MGCVHSPPTGLGGLDGVGRPQVEPLLGGRLDRGSRVLRVLGAAEADGTVTDGEDGSARAAPPAVPQQARPGLRRFAVAVGRRDQLPRRCAGPSPRPSRPQWSPSGAGDSRCGRPGGGLHPPRGLVSGSRSRPFHRHSLRSARACLSRPTVRRRPVRWAEADHWGRYALRPTAVGLADHAVRVPFRSLRVARPHPRGVIGPPPFARGAVLACTTRRCPGRVPPSRCPSPSCGTAPLSPAPPPARRRRCPRGCRPR